jgi:hypothetical protein
MLSLSIRRKIMGIAVVLILLTKCFPREVTTVTKSMLGLYGGPKPGLPSELVVNLYCCVLQWRPFPE